MLTRYLLEKKYTAPSAGGTGKPLFAWGYNGFGQLGLSTLVSNSSPVKIGALSWSKIDSSKIGRARV